MPDLLKRSLFSLHFPQAPTARITEIHKERGRRSGKRKTNDVEIAAVATKILDEVR